MIWTTHMIVGSAIAVRTGNPWLGFLGALASHYILDVIPHREYPFDNISQAGTWQTGVLIRSIAKVGTDFLVGLIIITLLFHQDLYTFAVAMGGAAYGIIPDAATFWYYRFGIHNKFISACQNFHKWCNVWHYGKTPMWIGVLTQVAAVAAVLLML